MFNLFFLSMISFHLGVEEYVGQFDIHVYLGISIQLGRCVPIGFYISHPI
jgi:hypothetical protein